MSAREGRRVAIIFHANPTDLFSGRAPGHGGRLRVVRPPRGYEGIGHVGWVSGGSKEAPGSVRTPSPPLPMQGPVVPISDIPMPISRRYADIPHRSGVCLSHPFPLDLHFHQSDQNRNHNPAPEPLLDVFYILPFLIFSGFLEEFRFPPPSLNIRE